MVWEGRGRDVFRAEDLVALFGTGVSRKEFDDAMQEFRRSGGREGLAHFKLGKGFMVRAESLNEWMIQKEKRMAGRKL